MKYLNMREPTVVTQSKQFIMQSDQNEKDN